MLEIEKLSYWERKSYFDDIDLLIIGAGIVGYSTAIHFAELNPSAKILILERGYLPSGASSKNAGFTCFGSATELIDDLQSMSEKEVWKTVKLRWDGLQNIISLIGKEELGLETNGSWDLITNTDSELFKTTISKLDYLNTKIEEITGEKNVYSVDNSICEKTGFEQIKTSIYNRLEGQIDTSKMNDAFYRIAINKGIRILFSTEVTELNSSLPIPLIKSKHGDISARKIAICTNGFASQFLPKEDIQPARAQVLITKPIPDLKIKGTFHYDRGYYYFRNIDGRILLGGGRNLDFEGETTTVLSNTDFVLKRLSDILSTVILPNTPYEIDYSWAGIMGVGKTKMPIIKKVEDSIYCGVRLGGMGIAIGTLVGQELAIIIDS